MGSGETHTALSPRVPKAPRGVEEPERSRQRSGGRAPKGAALPVKVETRTTLDGSLRLCGTLPETADKPDVFTGIPDVARGKRVGGLCCDYGRRLCNRH